MLLIELLVLIITPVAAFLLFLYVGDSALGLPGYSQLGLKRPTLDSTIEAWTKRGKVSGAIDILVVRHRVQTYLEERVLPAERCFVLSERLCGYAKGKDYDAMMYLFFEAAGLLVSSFLGGKLAVQLGWSERQLVPMLIVGAIIGAGYFLVYNYYGSGKLSLCGYSKKDIERVTRVFEGSNTAYDDREKYGVTEAESLNDFLIYDYYRYLNTVKETVTLRHYLGRVTNVVLCAIYVLFFMRVYQ